MSYNEWLDFAEKRKFIDDLFSILRPLECDTRTWRALEVGGEGGMLAGMMAFYFGHLLSTDIINSNFAYQGEFGSLLRDKFRRNGEEFALDKLEFLMADAQALPFRDGWFDFCFSQNAFEHIPDPEKALREMIRVTRPGGLIYLMFDPLWTADSGSHFLHYIGEPWIHLLENDSQIAQRMLDAGASSLEIESYRSHMNRRTIAYYREMFVRVTQETGVNVILSHEWSGCIDESFASHSNRGMAATACGLSVDDLMVRGLRFLLRV